MQAPETRVVTAADEKFKRSLWQYLRCVERRKLQNLYSWIAYDLGLTNPTRRRLEAEFPWCRFETFDFSACPAHVDLKRGNFAWKPCIIAGEMQKFSGVLFWFDSATLFKGNLSHALGLIEQHGIWYLRGQTAVGSHTDPRTLVAMNCPAELRHLAEVPAGALGFKTTHPAAVDLVTHWRDLALTESVVDPQPRWDANHKFDQSILSALIFEAVARSEIPLLTDEIDISSDHPISDITTRNKVAPWVPEHADLLVRLWHWIFKVADRNWLAFSRRISALHGGLNRHLKEHFQITVQDRKTGLSRVLPSPVYGYFADPFVWQKDGQTVVFAEEFQCAKDRGRLVAIELDHDLKVKSCAPLVFHDGISDIKCHASFPFLFEHDGQIYMVPETSARRTADLYACVRWPHEWKMARRLLADVDAADTMLVRRDTQWWLLTSVRRDEQNRHLAVYSAGDLLADRFLAHPANEARLFSTDAFGTGRNAGVLVEGADGALVRLRQNSRHHYGEGAVFTRVDQLDEHRFQERDCPPPDALRLPAGVEDCHHLSMHGDVLAFDRRTRASFRHFFRLRS